LKIITRLIFYISELNQGLYIVFFVLKLQSSFAFHFQSTPKGAWILLLCKAIIDLLFVFKENGSFSLVFEYKRVHACFCFIFVMPIVLIPFILWNWVEVSDRRMMRYLLRIDISAVIVVCL
jgi:hypothetical protein